MNGNDRVPGHNHPVASLPVVRACDLDTQPSDARWLIDSLWSRAAVGFVGGAPKSCKTILGLDIALSVATGTPCLGRFAPRDVGTVLLYLAEDAPPLVRDRLEALCHHRALDLASAPIYVITAPTLRLDLDRDQTALAAVVARLRPRLLLLDPFVRITRIHENDAGEVSAVLGFLRAIQRDFDLAIIVVHHTRKNGVDAATPAGQALRGSGDFHAWGDSNLYLRRTQDGIVLSAEHRAARPPDPIVLALATDGAGSLTTPHLAPVAAALPPAPAARHRLPAAIDAAILQALGAAGAPLSRAHLRGLLHVRDETVTDALDRLARQNRVIRDDQRWKLA
jgi:hypothetical protein